MKLRFNAWILLCGCLGHFWLSCAASKPSVTPSETAFSIQYDDGTPVNDRNVIVKMKISRKKETILKYEQGVYLMSLGSYHGPVTITVLPEGLDSTVVQYTVKKGEPLRINPIVLKKPEPVRPPGPPATIQGRIVDAKQNPLTGMDITIHLSLPPPGFQPVKTRTGANGHFQVEVYLDRDIRTSVFARLESGISIAAEPVPIHLQPGRYATCTIALPPLP